ncbi:LrgB family protein [Treponema sp.]|uniref:LrgB family protein n=1 Tax=Treponema sp. TaxID=166 RepID=UPI00298D701A|nr:LrgB family protein [Treponema sp.]MCQ2241955.1 LrgB family protein [Treponema sp.]
MKDLLMNSALFGVTLTLSTFLLGRVIHRKTNIFLFSPLLVSVTLCIVTLILIKIPYENYLVGGNWVGFFLTPSTVCLAVPLYEQFEKLKKNWYAILGGITCGVLSNLAFIFGMCMIFKIGHVEYVSMLPKSITTAIGLALADEFHGFVPITIMMIVLTGNLGNLFAPQFCRIFHITDPVAKGVATGTSSHALGTAKAIEMGDIEGAMSGLSIAVTGLLTVVFAPFFANLI